MCAARSRISGRTHWDSLNIPRVRYVIICSNEDKTNLLLRVALLECDASAKHFEIAGYAVYNGGGWNGLKIK
jgi:hypothetical protein